MRVALIIASGLVLFASSAYAGATPVQCRLIERQIAHYTGMAERANELDNPMWEQGMKQHLKLLKGRHNALLCPQSDAVGNRQRAAQAAEVLKMAGRAALSFFTMGAF